MIIALIIYDKSKLKQDHVRFISKNVFRDESEEVNNVANAYQTFVSYTFLFFVGIAALFILGFFLQ